jgi:hypothetical protein
MAQIEAETEESGPVQTGIWDTRNRENSYWCEKCKHWLRKSRWVTQEMHEQNVHAQEG